MFDTQFVLYHLVTLRQYVSSVSQDTNYLSRYTELSTAKMGWIRLSPKGDVHYSISNSHFLTCYALSIISFL